MVYIVFFLSYLWVILHVLHKSLARVGLHVYLSADIGRAARKPPHHLAQYNILDDLDIIGEISTNDLAAVDLSQKDGWLVQVMIKTCLLYHHMCIDRMLLVLFLFSQDPIIGESIDINTVSG